MGETLRCVGLAAVVVLALVLAAGLWRDRGLLGGRRDGFTAERAREACRVSQELFGRTRGAASFSEFKAAVPEADAVTFADARSLWKSGRLTPERMQTL